MNKKDIVIFDAKIAKKLLMMGFQIVNIAPDKRVPNATIFFFKDTDTLRRKLDEIGLYL